MKTIAWVAQLVFTVLGTLAIYTLFADGMILGGVVIGLLLGFILVLIHDLLVDAIKREDRERMQIKRWR